jgi:hypothetical protein
MEDEILSPSSSSSDLSGSTSTDETLDVFIPESEISEDPGTDYTDCGWGTEQVPPDFYETLSPEDKKTYDLLPNHGGLGRDPNDLREY